MILTPEHLIAWLSLISHCLLLRTSIDSFSYSVKWVISPLVRKLHHLIIIGSRFGAGGVLETASRNNATFYQGVGVVFVHVHKERSANTVFEQRLPGTSVKAMNASSD